MLNPSGDKQQVERSDGRRTHGRVEIRMLGPGELLRGRKNFKDQQMRRR